MFMDENSFHYEPYYDVTYYFLKFMDRTMLVLLNHIINALLIFCVKS